MLQDLTGMKFGRLTAQERAPNRGHRTQWRCLCDCGRTFDVPAKRLRNGMTTSCGCAHYEKITKHGRYKTPEYRAWVNMIARCSRANHPSFSLYGGRGIAVCAEWRADFSAFLTDMGERPSSKHSLDRIDNDGNYEPANCRWATHTEQMTNCSRNAWCEVGGLKMTRSQVARALGIRYHATNRYRSRDAD